MIYGQLDSFWPVFLTTSLLRVPICQPSPASVTPPHRAREQGRSCDVFSRADRPWRCPVARRLLTSLTIYSLGAFTAFLGFSVLGPRQAHTSASTTAAAPDLIYAMAYGSGSTCPYVRAFSGSDDCPYLAARSPASSPSLDPLPVPSSCPYLGGRAAAVCPFLARHPELARRTGSLCPYSGRGSGQESPDQPNGPSPQGLVTADLSTAASVTPLTDPT